MGLQQFERRLERLVEGAFARAFGGGLQPVEIGRRLTREMDLHRKVGLNGLIAPNCFVVSVSEQDFDRFESFSDALVRELAEAAREHARNEAYGFLGPIEVTLRADPNLATSTFLVVGTIVEKDGLAPAALVLPDGQRIYLEAEPLLIGRLPDCNVVLTDRNVSRRHAEVRRQGNDAVVVDLGSTNGTRVNGTRVGEHLLADGDEITVGTTTLRYETS
jgi:hypothetical protein